jgi:hypothetical protein
MRPAKSNLLSVAHFEELEPRALLSWTFFGPGPLFAPTPAPPTYDPNANSVLADFDGDGLADLATAAGNTISFAKGLPDGSFEANRTTTIGAPVGFISAGRFDGSGRYSLVAAGTRGGSITGQRPNPGFRLRAIAFDPAAHADINGATAGAFAVVTTIEVPDFHQSGPLPTAVVGDMLSGWRDEFALNLPLPSGENRIAVFAFADRTTIVRKANIATRLPAFNLVTGDILGTGKAQLVFARTDFIGSRFPGVPDQYFSTISVARPDPTSGAWSVSDIRTFPVPDLSFAFGDWDSDTHTDIVTLATRGQPTPQNNYTSDSRLWLIRSSGARTFDAPRALGERRIQDDWSAPPNGYHSGSPQIAGLADLNGDGRFDILLSSVSVFYYRINNYALQATVAIQRPDGAADVIPIPSTLGGVMGSNPHAPFSLQILPASSPSQPPSLLVSGLGLIRAVTDPQPPAIRNFYPYVQSVVVGGPSLGLPARFSCRAFDADQLRGGSINRVEYYIDTNNNGEVDNTDIHVGDATSLDAQGNYTFTATVEASWGTPGTVIHVLARAADDTGTFSSPAISEMDLS